MKWKSQPLLITLLLAGPLGLCWRARRYRFRSPHYFA
jgi:hypothetical protein